ncbi:SDR family NAD(P)-dependent oxidoreductase [Corynebacterium crudilactis]|uniref:Dehydrogenase n=1 Tax=Corynebacterium crudilactis TaxID=1652495 RepID=A0A172QQQ5_9CORY|nr:SDR family NAD(P)-dependent oxidoreductase [Corynebacterium crudilactis]ANE03014.1 dehydrogenase [Corynebacterium crudilactis]
MSLNGKVAIVTGSGAGLGRSFAQELARQGAAVIVNDVNQGAADETVAAIVDAGGQAAAVIAPVGSSESANLLVQEAVEKFGRLDILVTNAGILRDKSLLKMTDEDFDAVINVHLKGTFTCVRSAFGYFKENGIAGRIVTIGSPTGQRGNFGQSNYAAAKAGIVGMVRTWALEMKRAGVTINAIIPEAATDMTKTIPYFQKAVEADERGEAMPPFFRETLGFGTPQDVAGLVAFLSSDEAENISGQAIGAGGDRMQVWAHPEPAVTEFNQGGWTYEALQAHGKNIIEDNLQSVGVVFPALPEELQPQVPVKA